MNRPSTRVSRSTTLVLWATVLVTVLTLWSLPVLPADAAASQHGLKWVATWAQPMTSNYHPVKKTDRKLGIIHVDGHAMEPPSSAHNVTLRQMVRVSIGGSRVRIRLSNYFGVKPLEVTAAHIALRASHTAKLSAIASQSDRTLTFNGKTSVTIAPGQTATSDPVSLHVPNLSDVVVSLYFDHNVTFSDVHPLEEATTATLVHGNAVAAPTFAGHKPASLRGKHRLHHIYFLTGVDVLAPASTRGIVAFGDSITDGYLSTSLAKPWPEVLASIADRQHHHVPVAVINDGISGDELTTDQIGNPTAGMSGLKRFERDVIDQPGVTDVIVLFGANDINRGIGVTGLPTGARAGDIIAGLRMLADVAHEHHLRIYVGTIPPNAGFTQPGWYTPAKEAVRNHVNHWILHTHVFDGVIPFAKALKGKYVPSKLASEQTPLPPGIATVCTVGGLHPNDQGYAVMGTVAYNTLFNAHLVPSHPCH